MALDFVDYMALNATRRNTAFIAEVSTLERLAPRHGVHLPVEAPTPVREGPCGSRAPWAARRRRRRLFGEWIDVRTRIRRGERGDS
jgi:hypothetical protein